MRAIFCGMATVAAILPCGAGHAAGLPAGAGREAVAAVCTGCHGTDLIERGSGYTQEHWDHLTAAMIDLSGDPEARARIVGYLAEHFPPGDNRAATPAEGELAVEFEVWVVPTPGQRARDPMEAPDGSIWWVGQWADILGRLDPETGETREFALPAGARPHSVTIGPDGSPWYTGNGNGTLGRLDPETGEVEVFEMPDPAASDPHTAEFDAEGRLWFTLQRSNMVGRLVPETGEIRLVTAPTEGSRPYGVKVGADGTVWVACNGSNCLLRLARRRWRSPRSGFRTRAARSGGWTSPRTARSGSSTRRRAVSAATILRAARCVNGRPRADRSRVPMPWPSSTGESGTTSRGVRPDMLVRFDPATEGFQSWPIPSGDLHAGILRHMRVGRDGETLLIHQSATNTIGRVRIDRRPGVR